MPANQRLVDVAQELVPPHVLAELSSRPKTLKQLETLQNYDLTHITANLIDKGPRFSPEQVWALRIHFGVVDIELASRLEREFKRFIALSLIRPGNVYAPPGPVDMYWHYFVLNTRDYDRFCMAIWGDVSRQGAIPVPEVAAAYNARSRQDSNEDAPLTIVPKEHLVSATESLLARLRKLQSYNLSYFTEHLVDQGRIFAPEQVYPIKAHFGKADLEVAQLLELEFKRFAALTLIRPGIIFAPSGPVDMYWHFLILHSRDYRLFCDAVWGEFQHHPRGTEPEDMH